MRKVLGTLFFVIAISSHAYADTPDSAGAKAAVDHFLYGASINDAQIHGAFWADDLTYTSSRGTRFGRAELMSGMQGTTPIAEDQVTTWFSAEDVELKTYGETVIVNFTLISKNTDGDVIGRHYNSGVLVFRDNRWQAVNWNATAAAN
ncbi:nuclear transport factor 2 family protein [Aliidiomarina haloalkalitolerans]|uniref:Nuclear transport factor 2 family protein n=1 Tax=Aliidiomarina haloalkalitolerans TaxID=859059 RepID=A0A432VUK5_9GAMM|nr:nuclear transport factor 2 family protein [Aliidiomarina haloalkalitolerans]RUO20214.1 nuclear transport factor 2 family protein [Aliidiomarina haloalkalitolerans]